MSGGVEHLRRRGKRHALPGPRHAGPDAFAGNGAGDEQHLPVVPGDHPSTRRRFLDDQLELLTGTDRHGYW